jgi:deoxyadenosine/deoxycytidine kinase
MDFDEDDNPVITVKGVKGSGCTSLTADLERKLGAVTKDEKTREFREVDTSNAGRVSHRGGR